MLCASVILIFFQSFLILNTLFYGEINLVSSLNFDTLYNIDIFGQTLYNYFSICFLLAGLILLVSMIGAIVLTVTFKSNRKNELVFRQLARSENFLSFFY